jgi:two-component system, chemotaxis family, chemotaxis protein CheY
MLPVFSCQFSKKRPIESNSIYRYSFVAEESPLQEFPKQVGENTRARKCLEVKINVLIVDDSAAIRKILIRVLSQADLPWGDIHEASDGQEALNDLKSFEAALILSDINMPNMDGLQFLTHLRADSRWKQVPVIMISTEGNQAKVLEAVQLGANGYVRKPFTTDQIKEKVLSCFKSAVA